MSSLKKRPTTICVIIYTPNDMSDLEFAKSDGQT